MKKLLVIVLVFSMAICSAAFNASAESSQWRGDIYTEPLNESTVQDIYAKYKTYIYNDYLRMVDEDEKLGYHHELQTFDEYIDNLENKDIPLSIENVKCVGSYNGSYIVFVTYDDFWLGGGCERLGNYKFDLMFYGGLKWVYLYTPGQSTEFESLKASYDSGRLTDAQMNNCLMPHIGKLKGVVYNVSDINSDGVTSVSDVVELRSCIMNHISDSKMTFDIDGDGNEYPTVSDVIAMREIIMAD